jgi:hypothetical protein
MLCVLLKGVGPLSDHLLLLLLLQVEEAVEAALAVAGLAQVV